MCGIEKAPNLINKKKKNQILLLFWKAEFLAVYTKCYMVSIISYAR